MGSGVGVRCERCGRARGSDTVRWKSRENDIVGPGAEEPKTVLVAYCPSFGAPGADGAPKVSNQCYP